MRAKQAMARKCTIGRKRNKAIAEIIKYDLGTGREGELVLTTKTYRDPTADKVSRLLKKRKINMLGG
ncbi:MAG: hypothetical protein GXY17_02240 [Clostridiaceae bacterium]|nr:hypothetical protein [Clostridiaceae bacterium]